MPSINRIITARTAPLSMAADAPIMMPASQRAHGDRAHAYQQSFQRDASMIRLRTSRPNWSVPKGVPHWAAQTGSVYPSFLDLQASRKTK